MSYLLDTTEDQAIGQALVDRANAVLDGVLQELSSRAVEQAFLDLLRDVYGATGSDAAAFDQA
ncbi:MAG: hypothetical protein ACKOYH_10175, partial [Cyanobium sp.]